MKKGIVKKGDVAVICALLAAGLVLLLIFNLAPNSGDYAEVSVNGKKQAVLSLDKNAEYEIKNENGNVINILAVQNGAVHMQYAACPDQICVNHAEISKSGSSIVCLPNKVVVTVHSNKTSEPDGVAR